MKYIITESQFKLLKENEEKIIHLPSVDYFGGWGNLQKFLKRRGNPNYSLSGMLNLGDTDVESLGNLISIEEDLILYHAPLIKTLGKLKYVGGGCNLYMSGIKDLGDLEYVGSYLDLRNTDVNSFGNLSDVKDIYAHNTPLELKYSKEQIRSMINVEGEVLLF